MSLKPAKKVSKPTISVSQTPKKRLLSNGSSYGTPASGKKVLAARNAEESAQFSSRKQNF
jgi:hypothetical protein